MAASYDELAKQYPGSAGAGFKYLAGSPSPSSNSAQVAHDTRLAELAFHNLVNWGMSGQRGTLDAFKALVQKLPGEEFRVDLDRAKIATMRNNVESLDGKLGKSIQELEVALRQAEGILRDLDRDKYARSLQQDERLRIAGHKKLLEELKLRRGQLRQEADKLKLDRMIPKT